MADAEGKADAAYYVEWTKGWAEMCRDESANGEIIVPELWNDGLTALDSALALLAVDRELLNVVEEECQKGCPEWLGRVYEAWLARRARLAAQSHAPGKEK